MACEITYKDQCISLNNRQFSSLIDFVIDVGHRTASTASEHGFVDRVTTMKEEVFWPGRGIDIEDDFPNISERKFWAQVFLDTARHIFDREIGCHDHSFWQAQRIWQAYGTGQLFIDAVCDTEYGWLPNSIDYCEFDNVVNGIDRKMQ